MEVDDGGNYPPRPAIVGSADDMLLANFGQIHRELNPGICLFVTHFCGSCPEKRASTRLDISSKTSAPAEFDGSGREQVATERDFHDRANSPDSPTRIELCDRGSPSRDRSRRTRIRAR